MRRSILAATLTVGALVAGATHATNLAYASKPPVDVAGAAPLKPSGSGVPTVSPATVPEPAAWSMLLVGAAFVGGAMRRRARAATITA